MAKRGWIKIVYGEKWEKVRSGIQQTQYFQRSEKNRKSGYSCENARISIDIIIFLNNKF